jgi:hypothetical protein
MNKVLRFKYIIACFALAEVFLIQSCQNDKDYDVVGSTENIVYINTQSWNPIDAPKNSFSFKVVNTPVGSIISNSNKVEIKFAVKSTQTAKKEVTVKFEEDNSLVSEGYSALPDDIEYVMDKNSLTIAKGASESEDSITVSIDSDELIKLEVGKYMLPVRVSSVENAELSSSLYSVYLVINTSYSNCIDNATNVSGTSVSDRSAWSATANGEDTGKTFFDGKSGTYYYDLNFTVEIDLGSVYQNITGMKLGFYAWYYAMGSVNIYTSASTKDAYEFQGSPTFPSRTASQYVSFYKPVNARYIKIEITSPSYSSDYATAMTEFYLYQ